MLAKALSAQVDPTVFVSVVAFGTALDTDLQPSVDPVRAAVGNSVGLDPTLITNTKLQYVLQFVIAFPGVNQTSITMNDAALAAVVAATGAQVAGTNVSLLGTSLVARRRRLLGLVELTLLASTSALSSLLGFNGTVYAAVANGTIATAMRLAGVTAGAVFLPIPSVSGAQFTLAVRCPIGAGMPGVPAVLQALSPGGVDTTGSLLASFNAAGLGLIDRLVISELPVVGAVLSCMLASRRMPSPD